MPSWWVKKSPKNRVRQFEVDELHQNHHTIKKNVPTLYEVGHTVISPNSRISPRNSRDFTTGRVNSGGSSSSTFSGFDSDRDRAHPLPRPSISSTPSMTTIDYSSNGLRSGSASVSSVSSSVSSDEGSNSSIHLDHNHSQSQSQSAVFIQSRRVSDMKMSPRSGSRTATANTSPIHPRFSGQSLDSPTGRIECHPLPLPPPPGSPTRPPSPLSTNTRTSPVILETNHLNYTSKWKKGRLLGRGTFGQVYLGFNSENGQMCAIKEVKVISDDHTSRECLKQLNQEINLLSQLSHPNIVQYYGSELAEETLSVYLEYVSGGSIHKLLQEYGSFEEPVIQSYTRQILSGLAYLHGRNTVHRDIKGANILVDPNGEIKLADFGMAKHITACSSMLSFKGSPYWMAPEVVMNMNGYSLPVDIWSLGCTILEMASSKPPWSQYEGVAAIFKIGNSKDIPEIPDHLSSDAKSFISLCLQRDPLARPSALKLLDHPFVRDQGSPRFSSEGTRSPIHLPNSATSSTRQSVGVSRPILSSRENARTITSLPVSPCSSPLRDSGPAYKNCFLSPTHPSYAFVGQNNVNSPRNYHSRQPGKIYTPEPCFNRENNGQFKFQTSSAYPR